MYDYQGRSYLHIPQDVGINLRTTDIPDKCYLPKKQIHVWTGHTKVSRLGVFTLVSVCVTAREDAIRDTQVCLMACGKDLSVGLHYTTTQVWDTLI